MMMMGTIDKDDDADDDDAVDQFRKYFRICQQLNLGFVPSPLSTTAHADADAGLRTSASAGPGAGTGESAGEGAGTGESASESA